MGDFAPPFRYNGTPYLPDIVQTPPMTPATLKLEHTGEFIMHRGGRLPGLQLAFETWGELDSSASNAVLLFTGLSPGAHAASSELDPKPGWWEPVIGPGKAVDTRRFFVVCINSLGSCKGSTGPASINAATGRPWRLDFPELSIEDIAAAAQLVLDALGISRLKALIGPSMGGMTALAYLHRFPDRVDHLLSISSAPAAEPFSIAIRSLQREAIVTDPNFNHGQYDDEHWPWNGMRLARKLGMISYRSAGEWRERFGRDHQQRYEPTAFGMNFQIESYLEAAAEKFIGQFDPTCYIYLSRAMDWFDLCHGCPGFYQAMSGVKLKTACVIGVDSDILFPLHQQREIAEGLERLGACPQFHALPSTQGHDAFLVDYDRFTPVIADYFLSID